MAMSKRLVPVDKGPLRASGTVLPPEVEGSKLKVVAGYGGAAKDYAVVQHEDLTLNHKVGQSKFLEQPFNERAPQVPQNLAKSVGRAIKGLGH